MAWIKSNQNARLQLTRRNFFLLTLLGIGHVCVNLSDDRTVKLSRLYKVSDTSLDTIPKLVHDIRNQYQEIYQYFVLMENKNEIISSNWKALNTEGIYLYEIIFKNKACYDKYNYYFLNNINLITKPNSLGYDVISRNISYI